MAEVLTLEEMKHRYYGEWILVACTEMDAQLNPVRGEVIAHSTDRDIIYDEIAAHRHDRTGTLAIEYMGDIPEDWAAILCKPFCSNTPNGEPEPPAILIFSCNPFLIGNVIITNW